MSRLRKFDNDVLKHMLDDENEEAFLNDTSNPAFLPMDTAEQDDLIRRLKTRNTEKNESYLKILTVLYLIICGIFVLLATKLDRRNEALKPYKKIFLFCAQSISCSTLTLRYEFVQHLFNLRRVRISISSRGLAVLNFVLLIFLTWILQDQGEFTALSALCYVPHLLFAAALILRRLMTTLDFDISSLGSLKYKYKNV